MEIKIYYPSNKFLGSTSPVIYEYLLHGFKEIGEVIIDSNIDKECRNYVLPNNPNHLTVFYVELDGKKYRVVYDWSDFHHYKEDSRVEGDFYFKIHFLKEYYNIPRTYPIGQTAGQISFIDHLNRLRKIVEKKEFLYDVVAVYRTTNYDIRLKAVKILKKSGLKVKAGLKDFNPGAVRPYAPQEHKMNKLTPYLIHMEELARSRFVLALPAVDNSRAWKHTEGMGLGVPLLALDLQSRLPGDYQNSYIKISDNLSDLVEKIKYYKENESERLKIGRSGKSYFNQWLTPTSMANNIVRTVKNGI